jgi:hypothetical protein
MNNLVALASSSREGGAWQENAVGANKEKISLCHGRGPESGFFLINPKTLI